MKLYNLHVKISSEAKHDKIYEKSTLFAEVFWKNVKITVVIGFLVFQIWVL